MFYKGYRYLVTMLIVLSLFLCGFIIQITVLKKQLNELERFSKLIYANLFEGQIDIIAQKLSESTLYTSENHFYSVLDSILEERFLHYFSDNDIAYIVKDTHGEVIHLRHGKAANYDKKFLNQTFFDVTDIHFGQNQKITLLIPDSFERQNRAIILFFAVLWGLFCLLSIGFIVFLWEKQRRMQRIRLDVINNMSHEFKTPLTSIQLISEMMLQQGSAMKEERLKHYAGIIHQEADKMMQQAKQILNSAYYEQGKILLRKRVFNIHGLIEYVVGTYKTVFKENEILISLDLQAKNSFVLTDRNHFSNVITNLLDNARKYSVDNHAEVQIRSYNEGNKLIIEVEDNGIGIDTRHQKLIFDRFYRVPSGNIHEKSGYGVGLYYVKTILKKMNADIKVKSRPGYGSTFIINMKNNQQTHKK